MDSQPVAVITAGSGAIGGACARELRQRGYRLVLLSTSGGAHALAAELGAGVVGMTGSVARADDVKAAIDGAVSRFGRLDAVINNTGHTRSVATGELLWNPKYQGRGYDREIADDFLLEIADEDWHAAVDLLFLNVVRAARFATEVMRRQGGGVFVNISSYVAKEPSLALPVGSSVRAALTNFTKLYADRYGRDGIRMNTVLPGHVDNWPGGAKVAPHIPLGRSATPGDVAKLVAFLASDDSGYLTGQSIVLDGGKNRAAA